MTQTILLVEDSSAEVARPRRRLAQAGEGSWCVEHAGTLQAALDRLGKGDVHVVLLDLGLPDSSGLDTLAGLRQREPRVPVVVLTGADDEEMGIRALALGAQDYRRVRSRAPARHGVRSATRSNALT